MPKSDLRIDVLGTEITITTDEEASYLKVLMAKYRQTIENVRHRSGLKDPLKIAVLTGFLLCDDLEKAVTVEAKNNTTGEAEELTLGMISRLDEALKLAQTAGAAAPEEIYTVPTSGETLTVSDDTPQENYISPETIGTIFKLENPVKNYEWGSPEWIPAFLGQKNISRIPWAELWLGVNPAGPSRVVGSGLLSELIGRNPAAFLGKETAARFGTLPFLFKVLAAAKPLSIQVHPNAKQAREGFERENREGIHLSASNRNYKDPNEKSEILCAMSPFAALCGFRKVEEIILLMEILLVNTESRKGGLRSYIQDLVSALKQPQGVNPGKSPLKSFLSALFALESETLLGLGSFLKAIQPQLERDFPEYSDEWYLCTYLASLYPGDAGIIAPIYLNIMDLGPGEAIFIPAGTPHAYINGMGIELLSDSDNVLRGGLTPKHMDHAELMKILNFSEYRPEIMRPPESAATKFPTATSLPTEAKMPSLFNYPAGKFVLSVMRGFGARFPYTNPGPSILLVTEGVAVASGGAETTLKKGESAFIPAGKKAVFSGTFTAYIASCGSS